MPSYPTYRAAIEDCVLPLAFLDRDLLDLNIAQIAARAGEKRIRVASKSIRCRAVLSRILASGPPYAGVMCYTPFEAAFLAKHGLDDLLVGYPCGTPQAIQAACAALRAGSSVTLMVDAPEQVTFIAALAASEGVTIPLCLDLDLTVEFPGLRFGVWRSPVRTPAQALLVLDAAERAAPHVQLVGVMGYEAQIAGVGDAARGQALQNLVVRALKQRSIPLVAERRAAVVGALRARGAQLRFVNGGGTGSLESTRTEGVVTELTVGSGFFSPGLFDRYRDFRHQPAAGFALEVVRRPARDVFTCLGGGYVASGSAGPEKLPAPYLPEGAQLLALEGAGEVQTPVRYRGRERLDLGDPIFFRHAKGGELCEHFDKLVLIAGGRVAGEVPTYRGEGQTFL
jgi:D-serine deaminase-like pyridoxal phosphate-dependent protein